MAVRQEDLARTDLQSTMGMMPAFEPDVVESEMGTMTYNPDGSIDISQVDDDGMEGQDADHQSADDKSWNENLAERLNETERRLIADRLCEFLAIDELSRAPHFERMVEAINLLGVSRPGENTESAPFRGASEVTHPMIAEAVTQFQARAIEELMPASGPVKSSIVGKASPERQAQAQRIEDYMNYQLTEQDEQHFWNTDQMLFYLGLSGTALKKAQPDPITGMIVSRFVKDIDFIVPYSAKDLVSAPRYCHRYQMWENDIRRAKEKGTFIKEARKPVIGTQPDPSDRRDQGSFEDRADDRQETQHPDDTVSTILEYHIDYRMKWDSDEDIAPPYIITIDKETQETLAIRRNWRRADTTKRRRLWFSMYRYLPGLGFYGMGMLHMVGNLAIAASGAMRALLDAAAFANFQGGFKAKLTNFSGEVRLEPGVYKDVDATIDDLSKMFYTPPFKEPSPALAQMLQLMVDEGRRYLTTTENMVGDASNTGPVGTTLALIEQGSKVFSAIHKRMHVSARREYRMLAQLNYEFMPVEEYPYQMEGADQQILRSDFDGRVDVIPVSDPNIWSSTQRIAQAQATVELMGSDPELYGEEQRRAAHRRLLQALKVPDLDDVLPAKQNMRLDPVAENMNMMVGKAARAFYEQDHVSHMAVHSNFGQRMAGENPDLMQQIEPVLQAHIMEHKAFIYRQETEAELGITLPPHDMFEQSEAEELPPEQENMLAQAISAKMRPPPPPPPEQQDPEQQAAQAQADAAAKAAEDASDAKAVADLQVKAANAAQDQANKQKAFLAEEKRKQAAFDAQQARDKAAFEAEQKREIQSQGTETRAQMLARISKRKDADQLHQTKMVTTMAAGAAKQKPKPAAKAKPTKKVK